MKMKKMLAVTLAAAMVLPLTGCGQQTATEEKKDVTLTVWVPAEDQDSNQGNWLKTMCEQFSKEHENWNITFKYGTCSEGDVGTTIPQDPKNSADVYLFSNDQIGALKDANAIAKLGGDTAKEIKETNSEAMVNSVTVDGDIYGVPFTSNTWFMYYDKSVFNDEDIKSLDKMLEKGKVAFPMTTAWYNGAFFLANGGTMFGDGTDASQGIDFGGDKGLAAVEYMVDLVANPNFVNDADGAGLAHLRSGKVKAYFSGSWDYAEVKKILGDNFGAAQLPTAHIGGQDVQMKSFAGSKAVGVNPNAKDQEVAVALAKYLGSEEAQRKHYELRSVIPCNTQLLQDETIAKDVLIQAQNDTVDNTSIIQPTLAEMAPYWEAADVFGKALINKDITKANAKEKLDSYVKQLNSQN